MSERVLPWGAPKNRYAASNTKRITPIEGIAITMAILFLKMLETSYAVLTQKKSHANNLNTILFVK